MQIKLLKGVSGVDFSYAPDEVVDVDKALAQDLIDGGLAIEVKTTNSKQKVATKDDATA